MKTEEHAVDYDFEPQSLKGAACLISGGTTGIGRALAVALSRIGAEILIFGRHRRELDDAMRDIQAMKNGGAVHGLTADQADRDDVNRIFQEAKEKLGGLDILINNAGIPGETVGDAEDDWEYVVSTNLLGYMWCCEAAIPMFKERGGGQIVNIGSLSAKSRGADSDVYVATKSAIRGFTESLSKKLVDDDIRVMLIEPGRVSTDFFDWKPEERDRMTRAGEAMKAEDIAECILFGLRLPKRCLLTQLQIRPFKDKD